METNRCLCAVCILRRREWVDLAAEQQFDFDQWHLEPMIGWNYRYLGYMAQVLKLRAALQKIEDIGKAPTDTIARRALHH